MSSSSIRILALICLAFLFIPIFSLVFSIIGSVVGGVFSAITGVVGGVFGVFEGLLGGLFGILSSNFIVAVLIAVAIVYLVRRN